MRATLLIVPFTLLPDLGDAPGCVFAGRVWQGGQFVRWLLFVAVAVLIGLGWLLHRTAS
ncbi:hypothetical protein [Povalibacter sp.]|uniref:hypothetical protein n=1 Tax=Povalibacter sp. TaxID=1962978 RepID=UPI002F3E564F